MTSFQAQDLSLESQWRSLILFGRNSATYKFAFAKCLLEAIQQEKTRVTLTDLAEPFARHLVAHLRQHDKQNNANSSTFLDACRNFINGKLSQEQLVATTERLGFINVVDAFQVVNGVVIPKPFYEKNYGSGKKELILTDHLLALKESFHFQNFGQETEARWRLVETAWNLSINPNLLEVQYDEAQGLFFLENDFMRRLDITSVRDSLNGYQKGKCFYSFQDISVVPRSLNLCEVDHFLPHAHKLAHWPDNINGVWNLVLADGSINRDKSARVPHIRFLQRLYHRNEFFIESKHPLAETIVNQTGRTPQQRRHFLQHHYDIALQNSVYTWTPAIELPATF